MATGDVHQHVHLTQDQINMISGQQMQVGINGVPVGVMVGPGGMVVQQNNYEYIDMKQEIQSLSQHNSPPDSSNVVPQQLVMVEHPLPQHMVLQGQHANGHIQHQQFLYDSQGGVLIDPATGGMYVPTPMVSQLPLGMGPEISSIEGYDPSLEYSQEGLNMLPSDEYPNSPRRSKKVAKRLSKDLPEDSLAQRRAKNRISASISRKRKKEYIATLEQTNTCLSTERLELQLKVNTLTNYTWELQLKLEELEKHYNALQIEREELLKQRDMTLSLQQHTHSSIPQQPQQLQSPQQLQQLPPPPPQHTQSTVTQPPPFHS
ncbi:hypothetical protein Pelo_5507 [Pelomyxa schiedti]|nr:hypothetical protein Pelo_5507 [Pelomyxa schiedti]